MKIMKINLFLLCVFLTVGVLGNNVYAQAPYNDNETSKLRAFLMQESAEPGVKNYQQLGISQIDDINWGTVPGLTWNRQTYLLENIRWANKKLAGKLDISGFEALRIVYCENNRLTEIDLTGNSSMIYFDCYENDLNTLDVSTNVNLTDLCFRYNNLKEIDLSNNKKLTFLCSTGNQLEILDLSGLDKLSTCYSVGNQLTSVILDDCVSLRVFLCMENNLTTLDLSNKPHLYEFSCARNNISDINVTNCPSLSIFDCSDNNLQVVDLTGCTNLSYLKCSDNFLENIILDDCKSLEELNCENNLLASLKLPDSPVLTTIRCRNNKMDFYSLPEILPSYTNYIYYPQNSRTIEADIKNIDFSSFHNIGGFISRYTWNEHLTLLRPEMIEDGIFRLEDSFSGKSVICRIENESFPKLVLRYDVTLTSEDVSNVIPEKNTSSVYASEGHIHVVVASSANVRIFSLQGTLLMTKSVEEGRADIPVEKGMYIVSINNSKGYRLVVR